MTNWKREPLVWMIIAIPFSAIIMGVVMITLALKSETGMVVDDYYKKGKEINRVLARDEMALTLGLEAVVDMNHQFHRLRVEVKARPDTPLISVPVIHFFHATRQGQDQTVALHQTDEHIFQGTFDELVPGRWNVHLETSAWRLLGSRQVPGDTTIRLSTD